MKMRVAAVAALLVIAVAAWAYVSTPASYSDCIIKNAASAKSNLGAKLIDEACRDQFPPSPNRFDRFLDSDMDWIESQKD